MCGESEVGVFRIDGEFFAWHNRCAHRAGPVCQGRIMKRVLEPVADDKTIRTQEYDDAESHIVCPWHGYEYSIKTGYHQGNSRDSAAQGRADDPGRRDLCSSLRRDRKNDRYGWIDAAAPDLLRASRELVENNEASRVSDEAVAQILTAAIRLYVAKSDGEERTFPPIAGERDSEMTPTELLSAVSEMLRALHLGPMELALWYRRRPDEDTYSAGEKS